MNVQDRVVDLDREIRRVRRLGVAALSLGGLAVLVALIAWASGGEEPPPPRPSPVVVHDPIPDVVRVKAVEIVDDAGRTRAFFGNYEDGGLGIGMFDPAGEQVLSLGNPNTGGATLDFYYPGTKSAVSLRTTPDWGSSLHIGGKHRFDVEFAREYDGRVVISGEDNEMIERLP